MYILQKWLFFFEEQKIKDGIKKNWHQKSYEVTKRKDLKKKLHSWMVMVFSYSNNISWMKSSKLSKFHSSELSKFHTKIGVSTIEIDYCLLIFSSEKILEKRLFRELLWCWRSFTFRVDKLIWCFVDISWSVWL